MKLRHDLWIFIVTILVAVALYQNHQHSAQRDQDVKNQLTNRVKNVHTWCSSINGIIDYQRDRIIDRRKIDPTVEPYTLKDLNCAALEKKTAASAQRQD